MRMGSREDRGSFSLRVLLNARGVFSPALGVPVPQRQHRVGGSRRVHTGLQIEPGRSHGTRLGVGHQGKGKGLSSVALTGISLDSHV